MQADGLAVTHERGLRVRNLGQVSNLGGDMPARSTRPRQIRIQLEGPEVDEGFIVRPRSQRQLETPLAYVAPGTDGIQVNVDAELRAHAAGDCTHPL